MSKEILSFEASKKAMSQFSDDEKALLMMDMTENLLEAHRMRSDAEDKIKSLEAKNAGLEKSYEKLAYAFDGLNVKYNNCHTKNAELESKLTHSVQLMDAMTKTSQNNAELEAKNAELEKQIEHFKLISADHSRALDSASELKKKLEIAVECMIKVLKNRRCSKHAIGDCPTDDEKRIYVPINKALAAINGEGYEFPDCPEWRERKKFIK